MRVLERESEISAAQAQLTRSVFSHPGETIPVTIGYQSGSTDAEVHYVLAHDIWVYFGEPPSEKSPGDRYWNIFGLGRPSGNVSIACEINPAKSGLNRRVGGAFAVDASGRIWLIHRGHLNARGHIPFEYIRAHFRWRWQPVRDGNHAAHALVIDAIDSPDLLNRLEEFVREVIRFKEFARGRLKQG